MAKRVITVDLAGTPIIDIKLVEITPDIAKDMLKRNTCNRKIKPMTVDKYARDMMNHKWSINGIPIVIDESGEIKDGQHRLTGIVKSDISVKMLVVTVKSDDAKNYDNNLVRRMSDRLQMGEYADIIDRDNKHLNGTAAPAIATFCAFTYKNMRKTSPTEVAEFISNHADAIGFAVQHQSHTSRLSKVCIWAAIAAAHESGYSETLLERFCDAFNTGITEDKRLFPVLKLRNWCLQQKSGSETVRRETYLRTQYALKAVEDCNINARSMAAKKEYYSFGKVPTESNED